MCSSRATASPPMPGACPASASWRAASALADRPGGGRRAPPSGGCNHIGEQLALVRGPILIATDYVRAFAEQIRAFLPPGRRCVTLGTDGFGRRDTRAALRRPLQGEADA